MGWLSYYNLLKKYEGDISRATAAELKSAASANPNNPADALLLAEEKYKIEMAGLRKNDLKNFSIIKPKGES